MNELFIRKKLFINDICCGTYHSLALTSSGDIYSWGANKYGQIGIGSDRDCQPKPKKMKYSTNEKFKAISYGCYHSMALTEDGRVFACGYNEYGQLGDRTFEKSNQLKHIEMYEILIKKISCGATVSLLLSTDGDIYAFGTYDYWQSDSYRPIPTKLIISDQFCDIATIYNKNLCAALSPNGQFYAWGKFGPKEEMDPQKPI